MIIKSDNFNVDKNGNMTCKKMLQLLVVQYI